MGKNNKGGLISLTAPDTLKPLIADDSDPKSKQQLLQVVIETPKGSRNKYAYDHEQGVFLLRKVLPEGMVFPHDFGFLPRTLADDQDPIDVLLVMDVPAFPGCIVPAHLIGVMEGEQVDGKKRTRNDRLIAVAQATHTFANIGKLEDLPEAFRKELEAFFVNYHGLEGKKFRLLGYRGAKTAMELVKKSQKAAQKG